MAISTVTLTGDIANLIGGDFDARRTKVWLEANTDFVVDEDNQQIRLGTATATVGADGTFTFADLIASDSTDVNPTDFQYRLWVDYAQASDRTRAQQTFGWWSITDDADVTELIEEQFLEPTWQSNLDAAMAGYVGGAGAFASELSASYAGIDVGTVAVLVGNGTTDDTAALQAAIDATPSNGTLYLPDPATAYRMVSGVTISQPITIVGNKAKIKVDVPNASGTTALFDIQSDNVNIRGLWFDGSHKTAGNVPAANRYCIRALGTDTNNRREHITVEKCFFTDLDVGWFSGTKCNSGDPNLLVVHAFYGDWITDVHFENNHVDRISGVACFMRHSVKTTQNYNFVKDTGWYSLHYNGDDYFFEIAHNRVIGDRTDIRFWGGSLDIMGDAGPSYYGDVHDNYVSGTHTYGNDGAVRCSSGQHVDIHHNTFENIHSDSGSSSYVANIAVIAVYMRQAAGTANQLAPKFVNIHDNHAIAGCANQPFVLAQNGQTSVGGTGPIGSAVGLSVHRNQCETLDSSHYFASLATIHGQDGGWTRVSVERNIWSGKPGDTGSVSAGAVNILVSSGKTIKNVSFQGNQLTYDDGAGGVSSTSAHLGIGVGQFVDDAIVKGNVLKGFWFSVRAYSSAGTNLDLYENAYGGDALHVLVDSTVFASLPPRRVPRTAGLIFNRYDQDSGPTVTAGTGTPEGSVYAVLGAAYLRVDGGAVSSLYLKTSNSGGNTGWLPLLELRTSTTAALAAIGNSINTAGKAVGAMIFNTTTSKPVWAVGSTAGSVWVDATGATVHTPV